MDSVNHLPRLLPQGSPTVNCLLPPNDTKPQKTKSRPLHTTVQYPFQTNQSILCTVATLESKLARLIFGPCYPEMQHLPRFSYVHKRLKETRMFQNSIKLIGIGQKYHGIPSHALVCIDYELKIARTQKTFSFVFPMMNASSCCLHFSSTHGMFAF